MQFDRDGSVFYAAGGVPPGVPPAAEGVPPGVPPAAESVPPGVPPAASDEPRTGISARRA